MKLSRIVAAALILTLFSCADGDGNESPGDKREWSILQGQEAEYRGQVPLKPEFKIVDGYELMSVPSLDKSQRIWVMLWPKSPPFYKQIPEGNYIITEELLSELGSKGNTSSTVLGALRSHAEVKPNKSFKADAPSGARP